jgi:hypothetical protein
MMQPKEPAEKRAKRRCGNYNIMKRYLENKKTKESAPIIGKIEPVIAEVLIIERRKTSAVTRFESKFKRSMREMLDNHKKRIFSTDSQCSHK